MKNTITTLSLFCFAMLISCCKDDSTPNGNKPQTHSYMEATINGEPWKACRRIGAIGEENLTATYYQNDGYLQLNGVDWCKNFTEDVTTELFFEATSLVYDTGIYNLSLFNRALFSNISESSDKCNYTSVDTANGWLYIKEINTEKKYMSGEFEFTGYCEANDSTIHITNGKFNRISY
ncbi:MAG: hypothetical protein KF882_08320 [Bacteroidia bacterium]|nr:hypothetical protein [Bacteroidia bacterium]MCO5254277.1 DUF6252 family protein [Bacteroidota bacterium]